MKVNKLAITALGVGIVMNFVACDNTTGEIHQNSAKAEEHSIAGVQENIGKGVTQEIAAPDENNSFLIGEAVSCEGISGSKVEYTVTNAEVFDTVEESGLPSDEFIQGLNEAAVYFEKENGGVDLLVLTVEAEAVEDMQMELVSGRKDIHIMEFNLLNEGIPLGNAVYFQGGDKNYRKDKQKSYYYFAAPKEETVTLKAGYLVPEDWEKQNSLMLGIGSDLQNLSFVILDKEEVKKGNS